MTSATVASSSKIVLDFAWKGPNSWKGGIANGGFDIRVVDLLFRDTESEIRVDLPGNINPYVPQKFPFTLRRYRDIEIQLEDRKVKPLALESHPLSLTVNIEQMRDLTLRFNFFENQPIGPQVKDCSAEELVQYQVIQRVEQEMRLNIPDELFVDQNYTISISSKRCELSARLVEQIRR